MRRSHKLTPITKTNNDLTELKLVDEKENLNKKIYNVVFGKKSMKKHKTWEQDGFLEMIGRSVTLKDETGNVIGQMNNINTQLFEEGYIFSIGSKEVQIIELASTSVGTSDSNERQYKKPKLDSNFGKNKLQSPGVRISSDILNASTTQVKESSLINSVISNKENIPNSKTKVYNVVYGKISTKKHKTWENDGSLELNERTAILKDEEGKSVGQINNIKTELFEDGYVFTIGDKQVQIIELVTPQNDSSVPVQINKTTNEMNSHLSKKPRRSKVLPDGNYRAFVMPRPPPEHQWEYNEDKKPVVDIFVDNFLTKILRPHQRLGVVFLYECVMGFRQTNCFGAILADEMGLGKTLQCITLIWTLLKQGPYGGKSVIKRVLIVTPSSLVGNWSQEFKRWLGTERIRTFLIDSKNKPRDYIISTNVPVLIISYEMFVRYFNELNEIRFDLMICDEGHRLKNNAIKASTFLNKIECKRRVILTGTPIQNDLQEFYALTDFVNPGVLGTGVEYRKYYEESIVASRDPNAEEEVKALGKQRAGELGWKTRHFILRRTQDVLENFLPGKIDTVVFCKSSPLQQELYRTAVDFWLNRATSGGDVAHLRVITALKKICNHPSLIRKNETDKKQQNEEKNHEDVDEDEEEEEEEEISLIASLQNLLPDSKELVIDDSGKLKVLLGLLKSVIMRKEKIVIVSSYTQTLDVLADLCDKNQYKYCRLDGSTPSAQRTKIVENFNKIWSNDLVFLLSAKAGGIGLNLVGASRLVLFDSNWNPATDLQAMSRVWRDGQTKRVYLYRFLTAGTIEEKIYQRQISKTDLSGTIVDPSVASSVRMSDEELRDLFRMQFDCECSTHLLLNCGCVCDGSVPEGEDKSEMDTKLMVERSCQLGVRKSNEFTTNLKISQLMQWEHYKQPFNVTILDDLGLTDVSNDITFLFRNKCTTK